SFAWTPGLAPAPPPGRRVARLDAHHRPLPRARVLRVHGDRPGGGGGLVRGDRPGEDPGQVSPGEAAADLHPGALRLPAPGGAPRRAADRDARGDDLPLSDLEPLPRADRAQVGGGEPVPGEPAGAGRWAPRGDGRGALPGARPAGAQRARRRGGSREDPRASAQAPAVAPAAVGAERGHAILSGRAPEPRDERSLRRDDPRGRPRLSAYGLG